MFWNCGLSSHSSVEGALYIDVLKTREGRNGNGKAAGTPFRFQSRVVVNDLVHVIDQVHVADLHRAHERCHRVLVGDLVRLTEILLRVELAMGDDVVGGVVVELQVLFVHGLLELLACDVVFNLVHLDWIHSQVVHATGILLLLCHYFSLNHLCLHTV